MKKIQALILSFIMLSQSLINTPVHADEMRINQTASATGQYEMHLNQMRPASENKNLFQKEQKQELRLIVELEGEPIIARAIEEKIPYSKLSEEMIEEESDRIHEEQQYAMEDLAQSDFQVEFDEFLPTYEANFNGFVVNASSEDIEKIKQKPYVKNVYISQEFERPQLKSSHDLIGSSYAWNDLKYTGEGMLIAIIDTGVDPDHEAMRLDDGVASKHDENSVNALIQEHGLKGRYLSPKIPYGYNYYDHNYNTLDSYGSMHGMHVAGIAAANSQKKGVKGVAPNAQILALKVFSDDVQYPTTFTDVWIKAIDDAIKLKADVINMSLGTPAGLLSHEGISPEEDMIKRAKKAGILISISAGNDANIARSYYYDNKINEENPDSSLIASPSLYADSLSVASVENGIKYNTFLNFTDSQNTEKKFKINIVRGADKEESISANPVDLGNGQMEDFENHADLSGKIIMFRVEDEFESADQDTHFDFEESPADSITEKPEENVDTTVQDAVVQEDTGESPQHEHEEGKLTLLQKLKLAKSKNPNAILLYNTKRLGESLGVPLTHAFPYSDHTIALVGYEGSNTILSELQKNKDLEIRLSGELIGEINTDSGRISVFSSWGPTSDLKIKPEIAAPGGNIYSTVEEDDYRSMSGTSMASPHVAGTVALLKQKFIKEGVSSEDMVDRIKLALMNTAVPIHFDEYNLAFVRQQGAGLMQLDRALKNKVRLKATGEADQIEDGKLELGELQSKNFSYSLILENESDQPKNYKLEVQLINDVISDSKIHLKPESMKNFMTKKNISLNAFETKNIDMNLDFSVYSQFTENQFVEGFIILKDVSENSEKIDLCVPFLGFYGDWSLSNAIDAFHIKEYNLPYKRKPQFIVNEDAHALSSMFMTPNGSELPIVRDTMYFSPNAVKFITKNYHPSIGARLGVLRNLDFAEYSILDENTKENLRTLGRTYNVRKVNRLSSRPSYAVMPDSLWDGTLGNIEVKDGDHFLYQIKAKVNTGLGGKPIEQIYQYRVGIDVSEPQLADEGRISVEKLDGNLRRFSFKAKDIGSGLESIYLQNMRFVTKQSDEKGVPDTFVSADIVGENPDFEKYSPRFYESLSIQFFDSNKKNPLFEINDQNTLKLVDGKIEIRASQLSGKKKHAFFCDLGTHSQDEIEVVIEMPAKNEYMHVAINDHLANYNEKFIKVDGFKNDYSINFLDYYSNLKPNKALVSVNNSEISDLLHHAQGKSRVGIEFKEKNYKLSMLKIQNHSHTDELLKDGILNAEIAQKYNASMEEFKLEFDLDYSEHEYTILTKVEETIPEDQLAELSLEGLDFTKFQGENLKVILNPHTFNYKILNADNPKIKLKKGRVDLIGAFKEDSKIAVMQLSRKSGVKTIVKEYNEKDYEKNDNRYFLDKRSLFIKFDLLENAKLSMSFSRKSDNHDDFLDDLWNLDDNSHHHSQNKGKYPIIVLKSPRLLDILTEKDLVDGKIAIEGFVGYVKDDLENLCYSFVDEFGNKLSEEIEIPKSQIKKEDVHFNLQTRNIYRGMGYVFQTHIQPKNFNTNLRIEAVSAGGQRASITRRLFFDDQFANLSYEIADRKLSDANAVIWIKADDNSFKINLYRDNSLIEDVNLSLKSFESKDTKLEKEIAVPLKIGQNKIELKAVDLSLHESTKTIYIYRTK